MRRGQPSRVVDAVGPASLVEEIVRLLVLLVLGVEGGVRRHAWQRTTVYAPAGEERERAADEVAGFAGSEAIPLVSLGVTLKLPMTYK